MVYQILSGRRLGGMRHWNGPLVKWLRQRPLTPLTSVRIRYGSPFFLLTESGKVNIMFVAANAVAIVGAY